MTTPAAGAARTFNINLGCGAAHLPHHLNVDAWPGCTPDLVLDLEAAAASPQGWPWPTNSVDALRAHHSLEHMGATPAAFFAIMREAHRVLRPGGRFTITFPDVRSDGWWGDSTHVRPLTPAALRLFSADENRRTQALGWPNTPLALMLGIDFATVACEGRLRPGTGQTIWNPDHHFNVIDEWEVVLEARKGASAPSSVST